MLMRDVLLAAAELSLMAASREAGPDRTVSILYAQACVAAASLRPGQVVGEHAPDAVRFVRGAENWFDPNGRSHEAYLFQKRGR